jgi:hypothetical protein
MFILKGREKEGGAGNIPIAPFVILCKEDP